jgi:hypothetical protein
VVVVKAMAQAEQGAGEEGEFEGGGHVPSGRVRRVGASRQVWVEAIG